MARAIITVVIMDVTEVDAVAIKGQIEGLLKGIKNVGVAINIQS